MIGVRNYASSIEDAKHIRTEGCYDYTVDGKCSKCGSCCSCMLPLSTKEIKELKRLIKVNNLKPHKLPAVLNAAFDLTCPFLTLEKQCAIYEDRPWICKYFQCNKKLTFEDATSAPEGLVTTNVWELFE